MWGGQTSGKKAHFVTLNTGQEQVACVQLKAYELQLKKDNIIPGKVFYSKLQILVSSDVFLLGWRSQKSSLAVVSKREHTKCWEVRRDDCGGRKNHLQNDILPSGSPFHNNCSYKLYLCLHPVTIAQDLELIATLVVISLRALSEHYRKIKSPLSGNTPLREIRGRTALKVRTIVRSAVMRSSSMHGFMKTACWAGKAEVN